jgi:hypothetical protein
MTINPTTASAAITAVAVPMMVITPIVVLPSAVVASMRTNQLRSTLSHPRLERIGIIPTIRHQSLRLFVHARYANQTMGVADVPWRK